MTGARERHHRRRRRHRLRPTLVALTTVLALVLLLRSRAGPALHEAEQIRLSESFTSADREVQVAIHEGRFDEADRLVRSRLADAPRSCVPYRLALEVSERTGTLAERIGEWETSFGKSRDPVLGWAYAVALSEEGEDERASSVLSTVIEDGSPCLDAYRGFIRIHQRLGSLSEAESRLRRLDARFRADPYVRHALAFLAEVRGEGRVAKGIYLGALAEAGALPQSYSSLAALQVRSGELDDALAGLSAAGAAAHRMKHTAVELRALIQRAELLAWLGRRDESDEAFERVTALARELSDRSTERDILLTRAALASALGDPEGARAFFEQAETFPDESPTAGARAETALREGELLIAIGRLSEARSRLETARRLSIAATAPLIELDALLGLIQVTREEGSPTTALRMTRDALTRAIALEDGRRQVSALLAAATLYENLGRFDRAVEFLEQVLARTRRDADLTGEVLALSNLSLVHLRLGLPLPAVRWAGQARERSRGLRDQRIRLGVAQSLAAALAGAGRYEEAEDVFRDAVRDSEGLADVELKGLVAAGLGRVLLARGKPTEAREVFERALDVARGAGSRLVALQSRSGLGLALLQQGRLEEALTELEASLEDVESSRRSLQDEANRIRYAETRAQIYSNLTGVLIALDEKHPGAGYGERAFDVNERSRSRALLDMVSRVKPSKDPDDDLLREAPLSSVQIRSRVLESGELLLQFALGERESTLWAISPSESHRFVLPPRREIEEDVRLFLRAIRTPPRASLRSFDAHLGPGRRLYRTLIAPAEELVTQAEHLVLSPHGALNLLPFEALPREADDEKAPPSYLIQSVAVSYAPSASALERLRERAGRSASPGLAFLGIAQPRPLNVHDLEERIYPPIPFAALELETIAPLYPVDQRRTLTGEEASEEAVKGQSLSRYRVLHFAAHAEADAVAPERSAIVLGARNGGNEDGLLSLAEVLELELNSDLVVLSGCETGLGQVLEAEGTLGLAWAFLSAGSSAVAVSLWNVNDRSTSTVMSSFHRALVEGQSPALALADAKRSMLSSTRPAYRHPFYWAPFVLVGVGRR